MFDYGDLMTYILLLLKKMDVALEDQSMEMRDLIQRTSRSQNVPVKLASGKDYTSEWSLKGRVGGMWGVTVDRDRDPWGEEVDWLVIDRRNWVVERYWECGWERSFRLFARRGVCFCALARWVGLVEELVTGLMGKKHKGVEKKRVIWFGVLVFLLGAWKKIRGHIL